MRLADAAHLVCITKIRVTDIIAIEMSVKYCMNAITVSGSERWLATRDALSATTATMPTFISSVITGLTMPITVPACFSSPTRTLFAAS